MKAQHLLLTLPMIEAFLGSTPRSSFVSRSSVVGQRPAATLVMDMEGDIDVASRQKIQAFLQTNTGSPPVSLQQAEHVHGMPWKSSIDPALEEDALLYMPFWEWQMDFMKDSLSNLRALPCTSEDGTDFTYNDNEKKKARIVSTCFASDEYRKIRMTYYDAGDGCQVFNSVWYPDPKYNLPVLGIDLLSFNRKKYLAIVDFQPIHDEEGDHAAPFEARLEPIKEKYEPLKGRMSSKFYDETQFFSQQMLFARFEDENVVNNDLFPAFQEYVKTHLDLVKETAPDTSAMPLVLDRQLAYDSYSAERDPATGLFASMFGGDWADGFVYDFLFSLAEKKEGAVRASFGPPPGARKAQPAGH